MIVFRKKLVLLASVFFALGCSNATTEKDEPSVESSTTFKTVTFKGHAIVSGELVFSGSKDLVTEQFNRIGADASFIQIDPQNDELFLVRFSSDRTIDEVIQSLEPHVGFVEPNYLLNTTQGQNQRWPKDPEFLNLWGLNNLGQDAPKGMAGERGADISILDAWDETRGSEEIIVAVIDTGIDYMHPDLKDNIWVNEKEQNGSNGVDDDGNGYVDDLYGWDFVSTMRDEIPRNYPGDNDPMDDNGHGTHCAGTIAATGDNAQGVVGVAPNVKLMALKFLDKRGSGTGVDAYRAIMYATRNGAHILSNSWGGGAPAKLVKSAIEQSAKAGALFVAAAGNEKSDNDQDKRYPVGYDVESIVGVGASDNSDKKAIFSNYGQTSIDVFAPGVNILSTYPRSKAGESSPYKVLSGTSMATPHVAGVAALILSIRKDLRGNPTLLKKRLVQTSDLVPSLTGLSVSNGRVNAARAVKDQLVAQPVVFIEEDYHYQSPSFPTLATDDRLTIKKEGATAIQAHFLFAQVEEPYDSILVYDSQYRLVTQIAAPGTAAHWTPLVQGDTLHLRFINSLVKVEKMEERLFATPEDGFKAGANGCSRSSGETKWRCRVPVSSTKFYNFNSEGYVIDKIAYQK